MKPCAAGYALTYVPLALFIWSLGDLIGNTASKNIYCCVFIPSPLWRRGRIPPPLPCEL
jgi:hypothetical protein